MNIWIVTVGEPLPDKKLNQRLLRTGILVEHLVQQQHNVIWWTSTFDHWKKTHRYTKYTEILVKDRLRLHLLHGSGYHKNVSFKRLWDHYLLSRSFKKHAENQTRPDLIVSSFPTIELSHEVVKFGKKHGIPTLLDIRDLWPDIFLNVSYSFLKPIIRTVLAPLFWQAKQALTHCSGLMAVSDGYLEWGLNVSNRRQNNFDAVFPLCYKDEVCSEDDIEKAGQQLVNNGCDVSKEIIWFVGSFGDTYDLSTIILAARMATQQGWHSPLFVFSGSGDNDARWRKEASGLSNVIFTGWVDTPHSRFLMRHAKIGLLAYAPGAPQGLPNKLYEYLYAGLPILSSLQREMPEFLKRHQCGMTYAAGDAVGFLETMRTLMDDEATCSSMARNARRLYEEKLSANVVFPSMTRYFQKVVKEISDQQPHSNTK